MNAKTVEDKWSRDSWVLGGIVGAIVVAFIAISGVYLKGIFDRSAEDKARDHFISCVKNWSDAYTSRSDLLTELSTKRTDALDTLVRQIAHDPQNFQSEAADYLRASRNYTRAVRRHPVPASPEFVCSNGKDGVAPGKPIALASGIVGTPSPHSPATSRAAQPTDIRPTTPPRGSASVVTISAPRPTRTVTRPAPTVTTTVRPHPSTSLPANPVGHAVSCVLSVLGLASCPAP